MIKWRRMPAERRRQSRMPFGSIAFLMTGAFACVPADAVWPLLVGIVLAVAEFVERRDWR